MAHFWGPLSWISHERAFQVDSFMGTWPEAGIFLRNWSSTTCWNLWYLLVPSVVNDSKSLSFHSTAADPDVLRGIWSVISQVIFLTCVWGFWLAGTISVRLFKVVGVWRRLTAGFWPSDTQFYFQQVCKHKPLWWGGKQFIIMHVCVSLILSSWPLSFMCAFMSSHEDPGSPSSPPNILNPVKINNEENGNPWGNIFFCMNS